MTNVASLTKRRLKKNPVIYSIEIIHYDNGMSFLVNDVQYDERSADSIADDMDSISKEIRRLALCGEFD